MSDPSALARVLRQRTELGAPPFFFSSLDRDTVLRLAEAGMRDRLSAKVPALEIPPAADPSTLRPTAIAEKPESRPAPGPRPAPAVRAAEPVAETASPTAPPLDTAGMTIEALREAVAVCTR